MLFNPDQTGVDGARDILQRAFEQKVGPRVAYAVVLQGVEVEELVA